MHRTKSTYLHPSGNPITAKYIIVGLQPDRASIMSNRPFYGSEGMELDDNLHKANISRSDCYFTYLIKDVDRPIGFYIKTNKKQSTITGYTITPEGQEYVNLLAEELSKCNSNVILTLGNIPLFVLADRLNINKWHGSVILPTLVSGKNLVPCLDPASIIPPNYNYKNKRLLIFDLKRAKQVACGEWAVIPRQYTIRPSFDLCMQFLKTCRMFGRLGNIIWYDIEVDIFNGEMTCISFAYTPTDGISIPFTYERGDYFTIPQEIEILLEIARLLEDDKISIGGQNLAFDSTYMLRKYGICVTHMEDTMVAQKTLLPDYPVGLDFICRHYTDIPYYKEDGKYWLKGIGTFDMGWNYNITDSLVCAEAHPKQVRDLMAQGNYTTYLRKIKSIPPYVYIMEHGIKINLESMSAAYDQMQQQSTIILKELEQVAGQPLNPNSPKQIAAYFYDVKRLPAYKSKSGGRSTDEKALKRISRKGYKEAKLILRYRHLIKASSTFLNPGKVDSDSRMRCSYNPVGTRYARASSSENIFGTGNNLQNQPHHVLTHFEADPDYVFYGLDLSQAENRIVAYVGRIFHMIECFETGQDVHALTARIILAVIYGPDVAMTKSVKDLAPIGDGTKTWRDWGKKCVVGDTEILTPHGWVKISDWNYKKTQIAQWEKGTKNITFVDATNCSMYLSEVIELQGRNSHVVGTPNHRIPLYRSDRKKFSVVQLKDISKSHHYGIPTNGKFNYQESLLTSNEVKLLVAFQADGGYNHSSHRFKFSKLRKIKRIEIILNSIGIPYNKSLQSDGSTLIGFKGPFWLTKDFSSNLLHLGYNQMVTFVDELKHWDGYFTSNRKQYFSTNKNNVEWAQTIAHLCGFTALIEKRKPTGFGKKYLYVLNYNNTTEYATLISQSKKKVDGQHIVYGPEVPSGFFLIRSKGRISVTGNSNHGLNYGQTFKPFSLQNEIPERDGKLIVETYHKGYTGIRNGYHAYVKKCLSNNRTLKNLMGRSTLFTDKISDQLYNEAYACIPQGTVGDIIDQRGLSYVYYNTSPLFKHVELMIQVHDQIGFQIPTPSHPTRPVPWEDHSKILEMVKNSLETPLYTHYKKKFIIPVDIMMGKCLNKALGKDLKSIDPRTLENTWNSVLYNTMLNSYLTMQEIKNA